MHPSQNSAGPEQLNASKLKDANEKIDFSLSLQVLLVRKYRLNYSIMTVCISVFQDRRDTFA